MSMMEVSPRDGEGTGVLAVVDIQGNGVMSATFRVVLKEIGDTYKVPLKVKVK
jgi:hypothetical protein